MNRRSVEVIGFSPSEHCFTFVTGSILMDTTVLQESLQTLQTSRILPRRTRSVEVIGFNDQVLVNLVYQQQESVHH
jgi:hypothetical protein